MAGPMVYQGAPCARCGSTERNANRECRACAIARSAAWRAKNPEREKANAAAWRAKNAADQNAKSAARRAADPEKRKAYVAAWAAAHKEKRRLDNAAWASKNRERVRASNIAWRAENKEAKKLIDQNRRARKRAAGGRLTAGLVQRLFALQKGRCACCGQPLGKEYHLDHIIPLALGGPHEDTNMQLLRAKCNLSKRARDPIAYMQSKGFLL